MHNMKRLLVSLMTKQLQHLYYQHPNHQQPDLTRPISTPITSNPNREALWSLEFGVGILHEFLLINFGGASYCRDVLQGRILT